MLGVLKVHPSKLILNQYGREGFQLIKASYPLVDEEKGIRYKFALLIGEIQYG